jgi:class 3 adenylate cyclase
VPEQSRLSSVAFFERLGALHSLDERRKFEQELGTEPAAILAADSSGFTRTTQRLGIVHFLGIMTLAYRELGPIIERGGGSVLSENADNIMAIFDDPRAAAAAAQEMQAALARRNDAVPDVERFSMCIGIDYGRVLRLSDNAYGDHVNKAFKIGEDLARRGETLVTHAVAAVLDEGSATYIRTAHLGDEEVKLYRVGPEATER